MDGKEMTAEELANELVLGEGFWADIARARLAQVVEAVRESEAAGGDNPDGSEPDRK